MITNAKNLNLKTRAISTPIVGTVLSNWQVPLVLQIVETTIVNFMTVKNLIEKKIKGMWLPNKSQELELSNTGIRFWTHVTLITPTIYIFEINDEIYKNDIKYKIASRLDYSDYGIFEYNLIEGYSND